jgi:hypothetical protein
MINYNILAKKITEHYTIEFTDLVENEETVKVQISIFGQVGNEAYLNEAIEKRYQIEKTRLEEQVKVDE